VTFLIKEFATNKFKCCSTFKVHAFKYAFQSAFLNESALVKLL